MPFTQLTMNHMIAGQQTGTQFNRVILGCRRPFHSLIQPNEIGRQLIISRFIVVAHASIMHETVKLKASRSDGFTFIGRMNFYLCCRLSRGDPTANSCRAGPLRRQPCIPLCTSRNCVPLFDLFNNVFQTRNDVHPTQFLFSIPNGTITPFSWSPYKTSLDPSRRGTMEITRASIRLQ